MATAYIRVPRENAGKGMITHVDKDTAGFALSFKTLAVVDGDMIMQVDGDDSHIIKWQERVNGEQLAEADAEDILASVPAPFEEQIKKEINDLKQEVAAIRATVKAINI